VRRAPLLLVAGREVDARRRRWQQHPCDDDDAPRDGGRQEEEEELMAGAREGGRGGVEREDERTPYLFLSKTVENIIKRDIFCGHVLCASTNLKA
jgi:hypothetical protein